MNPPAVQITVFDAVVVEDTLQFTLADLCRACQARPAQLVALVDEGVLRPLPAAGGPDDWRFEGSALARARAALRLLQDLQLNVEATALVVDLLDEIDRLKGRLRRAGLG